MIYTVKRIEEDLDFGCEERPEGYHAMAIVILEDDQGNLSRIKQEDAGLYERGIDEGVQVCLDEAHLLQRVITGSEA